jgi:hypothetical protein
MLSIRLKKFFGATLSRATRDQRGQSILEYILVLMVVVGMIFVLARPVFGSLQKKIGDSLKQGFFTDDPTGGKFYYFNIR